MLSKVRENLPEQVARLHGSVRVGESTPDVSDDVIFDILRNRRRRIALEHLRTKGIGTRVSLDELATTVAARENDCTQEELTSKQRKRTYVALKQSHLPKLADAGVIDYEPDRGWIALTERAAVCDVYFEVVAGRELPWSLYYLGLGAVCTVLVFAVWVDAFPFALASPLFWAGCITAAFTLSALVHVAVQRRNRLVGAVAR